MFVTPLTLKTRYSLADAFRDLDRMETSFFAPAEGRFATDIIDEGAAYRIEIELPGFSKEEIAVSLEGKYLTVSAKHEAKTADEGEEKTPEAAPRYIRRERGATNFSRSFSITGIETDGIEVQNENGILILTLPKKKPVEPEVKHFEIK